MQIKKLKKEQIKFNINSFQKNTKLKKKPFNEILRQTKSLLFKKTIYNFYMNNSNNYNIINSNSHLSETTTPITERPSNHCLSTGPYNKNNSKIYQSPNQNEKSIFEDTKSYKALNNSSLILNLKNNINKKFILNHCFFHDLNDKTKNIFKNNNINNNSFNFKKKFLLKSLKNQNDIYYGSNKILFEKIKKKIEEYKKENFSYMKNKPHNNSYNSNNDINSLFIEFFYKWNKNNINNKFDTGRDNMSSILNNKYYSDLIYNENEIFHFDFSNYISDKIEEYKKNQIQNLQHEIHINFNDANDKEIFLMLKGIKLNFIPFDQKERNISFYLPFTYSILFYYKGINFFRSILLSLINFNDSNFDEIAINYDELNTFINKKLFKKKENEQDLNNTEINRKNFKRKRRRSYSVIKKTNADIFIKRPLAKKFTKMYTPMFKKYTSHLKFNSPIKENIKPMKKNMSFHSYKENENMFFNSYFFIWETPKITYKVILEMPKITFKYQDIPKNIETFCHKNMMLFLLKNNFINWDFYLMNYLFSLKSFRKLILSYYSYNHNVKNNIFTKINNINYNKFFNDKKRVKFNSINFPSQLNTQKKLPLIKMNADNDNHNIEIQTNSINHLVHKNSEKDEIFYFFYTNNLNINYLISFHSYQINIEYDKLNPNISFTFYINFKQMKFLEEIKKYELLENFVLKIIKTNFEKGQLSIDLSVFEEFDPKILNYKKKEIVRPYHYNNSYDFIFDNLRRSFKKPKNEILIKIKNPSVKIEKYSYGDNKPKPNFYRTHIGNEGELKEINEETLKKINKLKINMWPKLIVDFIKEQQLIESQDIHDSNMNQKQNTIKRTRRKSSTFRY